MGGENTLRNFFFNFKMVFEINFVFEKHVTNVGPLFRFKMALEQNLFHFQVLIKKMSCDSTTLTVVRVRIIFFPQKPSENQKNLNKISVFDKISEKNRKLYRVEQLHENVISPRRFH